jgi:hypothetical protein
MTRDPRTSSVRAERWRRGTLPNGHRSTESSAMELLIARREVKSHGLRVRRHPPTGAFSAITRRLRNCSSR